jgi:GTP-binding protein
VLAVDNKLDHVNHADRVADFYELGLPLLGVSAEHSRGMSDLWDAIAEQIELPTVDMLEQDSGPIPVAEDEPESVSRVEWKKAPIRVAVVGRPNVGKSSLVNTLLGEERLLATPVAGTTRDPIDVELRAEVDGEEHKFIFVDTAGIRRKRSVADRVEQFSVMAALRSIERADVVLVVLDGAARPSEQDMRIATLAHEKGKGLVLVANKWDLVENPEWAEGFPKAVRLDLAFATYAPLLLISAKTGRNTQKLFGPIVAAQRERHRRISTGALNRFFHDIVAARPPDFYKGRRAKLFFVSQPLLRPPTFIFACKDPDFIPTSYARFLRNRLREEFGFGGTPIWLKFRPRGRQKNTRESLSLDK